MRRIFIVAVLGFVLSPPAERIASTAEVPTPQGQQRRTVYVSVTEKDGTPVTDLTAADFDIKEGGKTCDVAGAELTKTPIRLALIVADAGSGGFQVALATLVQRLQDMAEFSVTSVINQPDKLVDFTTDLDKVVEGLKRLGPRGTIKASGQVIEAIDQAIKEMPKDGRRPVMIVMTVGGSAASEIRGSDVREALRKTGTLLYVLSPVGAGNSGSDSHIDLVLNDGSRDTGGRHDRFSSQTLVKVAEQISQELLNQYQLSYVPADGAKPGDRLEVSSKRKGVKVNAPSRLAD